MIVREIGHVAEQCTRGVCDQVAVYVIGDCEDLLCAACLREEIRIEMASLEELMLRVGNLGFKDGT